MKKVNYFGIAGSLIMIISVFLPWVEVSSSATIGEYSASFKTGGISGIYFSGGIIGLRHAIVGGFLLAIRFKGSIIIGILNLLIGIGYTMGWFSVQSSYQSSFGDIFTQSHAGINPQYGLFLFIFGSVCFIIASLISLTNNPKNDVQKINSLSSINLSLNDTNRSIDVTKIADELTKLKKLMDDGVLTDHEFTKIKNQILESKPTYIIEDENHEDDSTSGRLSLAEKKKLEFLILQVKEGEVIAQHINKRDIEIMSNKYYENWIKHYGDKSLTILYTYQSVI